MTSCAHLGVGAVGGRNGYYARCRLGDAEARREWIETMNEQTLGDLRSLSSEYRSWVQGRMTELWARKSQYLEARARGDRPAGAVAASDLRAAIADLVAQARDFLQNRARRLHDLGLAPDLLLPLIETATERWAFADTPAGEDYQVPEDVLDRFPPRVRLFVTASRPATVENARPRP